MQFLRTKNSLSSSFHAGWFSLIEGIYQMMIKHLRSIACAKSHLWWTVNVDDMISNASYNVYTGSSLVSIFPQRQWRNMKWYCSYLTVQDSATLGAGYIPSSLGLDYCFPAKSYFLIFFVITTMIFVFAVMNWDLQRANQIFWQCVWSCC